MQINNKLKEYVEQNIYPIYNTFDKGHDINHVKAVVKRSLEYYKYLQDKNIDINIVFVVAAYHDVGCKIQRKNHAYYSGQIVKEDKNLEKWFDEKQIKTIKEACEDHSTSSKGDPRSIYGQIVSDADKDTDVLVGLKRGWDYACEHKKEMSLQEKIADLHREMSLRFCDGGTVKFYINSKNNTHFLKQMKAYVEDEKYFEKEFIKIARQNNWI